MSGIVMDSLPNLLEGERPMVEFQRGGKIKGLYRSRRGNGNWLRLPRPTEGTGSCVRMPKNSGNLQENTRPFSLNSCYAVHGSGKKGRNPITGKEESQAFSRQFGRKI